MGPGPGKRDFASVGTSTTLREKGGAVPPLKRERGLNWNGKEKKEGGSSFVVGKRSQGGREEIQLVCSFIMSF